MRKYEVMYILKADLDEAARKEAMDKLAAILTDNGAKVEKTDESMPRTILSAPSGSTPPIKTPVSPASPAKGAKNSNIFSKKEIIVLRILTSMSLSSPGSLRSPATLSHESSSA